MEREREREREKEGGGVGGKMRAPSGSGLSAECIIARTTTMAVKTSVKKNEFAFFQT